MVAGLQLRWHHSVREIAPQAWNALLDGVPGARPFLTHEWLCAMEVHGCATADTGWQPLFLGVYDTHGVLQAACPTYLKYHSYGEYVFDWAWADAHDRAFARQGRQYFPKLLGASPFSPIPGQRLLTRPGMAADQATQVRQALLQALQARCLAEGWSSAHVLFVSDEEARLGAEQGWLVRRGVQFHWTNRAEVPYADFNDFLSTLQREKRKKILQERRKVAEAGVSFRVVAGTDASAEDWSFFYRCYETTYHAHGQRPYLNEPFWHSVGATLAPHWVLFVAEREGQRMACSLVAVDPTTQAAYGRYWGALDSVSCLHFEACYYQPLAWCMAQGLQRFEGGAQGEHKLARGLMPVDTQSLHWLAHPGLSQAVADFLMREKQGLSHYVNELDDRRPFKPQD